MRLEARGRWGPWQSPLLTYAMAWQPEEEVAAAWEKSLEAARGTHLRQVRHLPHLMVWGCGDAPVGRRQRRSDTELMSFRRIGFFRLFNPRLRMCSTVWKREKEKHQGERKESISCLLWEWPWLKGDRTSNILVPRASLQPNEQPGQSRKIGF